MPTIVTNEVDIADSRTGKQKSLLWWLIPVGLLLLWIPFRLCSAIWLEPGSPLVVQLWVPVAVIFLIWTRRTDWRRTSTELTELFPDPRDFRRSGNIILAALGGIGLILSNIASIPFLSILSFCFIVLGTVFYLYGPFLLRSVISPLLLLFCMTPPPFSVLAAIMGRFQLAGATMFGGAMDLLGAKNRVLGGQVTLQQSGYRLDISPSLSGVSTFVFVFLIMATLLIWKRVSVIKGIVTLIISAFLTVIVNMCRLLIIGTVGRQSPTSAETLAHVPALPTIICAFLLCFLFTRKLVLTSQPKEDL